MQDLFDKIETFLLNEEHSSDFHDQPQPFVKKEKEPGKESVPYDEKLEQMFANTMNKLDPQMVSELRFTDFVKDPNNTARQKINKNIKSMDKKLREIIQLVDHSIKLKKTQKHDDKLYWKPTIQRFGKIDSRIKELQAKLRLMK